MRKLCSTASFTHSSRDRLFIVRLVLELIWASAANVDRHTNPMNKVVLSCMRIEDDLTAPRSSNLAKVGAYLLARPPGLQNSCVRPETHAPKPRAPCRGKRWSPVRDSILRRAGSHGSRSLDRAQERPPGERPFRAPVAARPAPGPRLRARPPGAAPDPSRARPGSRTSA